MYECVTTSTYRTRAKPEGCMYFWLLRRTSYGIVLATAVSRIYMHARHFDLRHKGRLQN